MDANFLKQLILPQIRPFLDFDADWSEFNNYIEKLNMNHEFETERFQKRSRFSPLEPFHNTLLNINPIPQDVKRIHRIELLFHNPSKQLIHTIYHEYLNSHMLHTLMLAIPTNYEYDVWWSLYNYANNNNVSAFDILEFDDENLTYIVTSDKRLMRIHIASQPEDKNYPNLWTKRIPPRVCDLLEDPISFYRGSEAFHVILSPMHPRNVHGTRACYSVNDPLGYNQNVNTHEHIEILKECDEWEEMRGKPRYDCYAITNGF